MRNIDYLLGQKALFDQYVNLQPHQLSTFHFSSIFLWQDFFDFEFEVQGNSLCVYAHQPKGCFLYLPPLSAQLDLSVIESAFSKMNAINPRVARIENVEQPIDEGDKYKIYPKTHEYVYRKQDLIDLKGHAYKSQRHDIHHFLANTQATVRPYRSEDFGACIGLYQRWAQNRHDKHDDPIYRTMLDENKVVHELALIHHKALGLLGCVVEKNEEIIAYSLGYSLKEEVFCVLLEIVDVGYAGLNAFIFNRFCADEVLKPYTFINTMDDFGLPYVAASKEAYHPYLKPVSYTVTQA